MPELKNSEKALKYVTEAYLTAGGLFSKWYVTRRKKGSLAKARELIANDLEENKGEPKLTEALKHIDKAIETWSKEIGAKFGSDEFLKLVQEENESWKKAAETLNQDGLGNVTRLVNGWYNQTLAHLILNQEKWKDGSKTLEKAGEEFYNVNEHSLTLDMIYRAALVIIEHTRHRDRGARVMVSWAERFDKENQTKLASKAYYLAAELYSQKVKDPTEAYRNYLLSAKRAWKAKYVSKVIEASMEAGMSSVDRAFKWLWNKIRRR